MICHEIWGVTPSLERVARDWARRGFRVTVPSFYAAVGQPPWAADEHSAYEARAVLDASSIEATLAEAIERVRADPGDAVAVLGYSMGGTIALWAATLNLPISHAVTYYGGGLAASPWGSVPGGLELLGRLVRPWLGLYGGRDPLTPAPDVTRALRITASSPLARIRVYDDADHAWALDPSDPRYSARTTALSDHEVMSFLRPESDTVDDCSRGVDPADQP